MITSTSEFHQVMKKSLGFDFFAIDLHLFLPYNRHKGLMHSYTQEEDHEDMEDRFAG
jgi:hypothetical protein